MAGISDKAAGGLENKYKYNGIELDTSLGLNEYDAQLRDLDPQTGRWWQIDPETEGQEMWSPYTSNNDNPIRYDDPLGNEGNDCCEGLWKAVVHGTEEVGVFVGSTLNAISTNQVGGVGRSNSKGWSDPDLQSADQMGKTVGDGLTILSVGLYDAGYGVGTVGSGGTLVLTPATALAGQQNLVALPAAIKNLKKDFAANNSSSSSQNRSNQTSNQSTLTKPPKGKGKVPPSERDPQRLYTRKQKQEMLDRQNGRCASCGEEKTVDEVHGHHDTRHADGGRTRTEEGHAVCKTCHVDLHR